jgi:tripeptidyl-peptidase-1
MSLAYPNPVTYLSVGYNEDEQLGDEYVTLASYLQNATDPPTAISVSYADDEQKFSPSYMTRICNEFMKVGSRGISIFFATGDGGIGGNGNCPDDTYYVAFPASCPYVTAVGATQFVNGSEEAAIYEGTPGGSTAGGFSSHFSVPSYQSSDTASYIKNNLNSSYDGSYNSSGRGTPDIALIGKNFDVVTLGHTGQQEGTSASSPAWAALVTLINDYRISEGKPTLGFLNPLLYANGAPRDALRDVIKGHNPACGVYGYPAATGWDPTTGLGSLDFGKMLEALA